MEAFLTNCPTCCQFDQEVLFPSFYASSLEPFQNIVICRKCGCVFRNPHVPSPDLHYTTLSNWGDGSAFRVRFEWLSKQFGDLGYRLAPGEKHLDIGTGPGWFPQILHQGSHGVQIVCLEPSPEVAQHAKNINPDSVVVPSRIDEVILPYAAFKLITACGVDYLFRHYRRDTEKIAQLLTDDGTYYVERNVFIPQGAYALTPVLDLEDQFGSNNLMNVWFHREQFSECMGTIFDVENSINYTIESKTADGSELHSDLKGLFCKKKRPNSSRSELRNWYFENITHLQSVSRETSIHELKTLTRAGIRNVAICGTEIEAQSLATLIDETGILNISAFLSLGASSVPGVADRRVFDLATCQELPISVDAILLASIAKESEYQSRLSNLGRGDIVYPCFRRGISRFEATTTGGNKIQLKAFLPATIAGMSDRAAKGR